MGGDAHFGFATHRHGTAGLGKWPFSSVAFAGVSTGNGKCVFLRSQSAMYQSLVAPIAQAREIGLRALDFASRILYLCSGNRERLFSENSEDSPLNTKPKH